MARILWKVLLGQFMFIRGVEAIGPARAGVFINLVPVFGAAIAVALMLISWDMELTPARKWSGTIFRNSASSQQYRAATQETDPIRYLRISSYGAVQR